MLATNVTKNFQGVVLEHTLNQFIKELSIPAINVTIKLPCLADCPPILKVFMRVALHVVSVNIEVPIRRL